MGDLKKCNLFLFLGGVALEICHVYVGPLRVSQPPLKSATKKDFSTGVLPPSGPRRDADLSPNCQSQDPAPRWHASRREPKKTGQGFGGLVFLQVRGLVLVLVV